MTYRELAAKITLLKDSEMDSEVTFYDDSSGRYHPVSKLIAVSYTHLTLPTKA